LRSFLARFCRPLYLAFGLGLVSVAGFAPFYLYPLPIVALAALFYLWRQCSSPKQAARLGFAFGLGLYGGGIYWIYISLHQFGGMPIWMAALSTFCLCAFMALFPALVAWLAKRWHADVPGTLFMLSAAALWALSDWVRSWIFTGFPWLTLGYSQVPFSPFAGYAPIFGIYGVSLLTALAAGLIALWNERPLRRNIVLGLALLWIAGSLLKLVEWSKPDGAPVSVALVQGNIAQNIKWRPDQIEDTLARYFNLTLAQDARLIILPEIAFPLTLDHIADSYLGELQAHAERNNGDVLFGAVELQNGEYFNSMFSLGSAEPQVYRKSHLVPFGEFIPLKSVFGWIYRDWLNIPLTDISRGSIRQQPMAIAGQRVAVNICYEDVFGEEIIRQLPQASLLVNASNDAWYGDSIAADQHLQISQARALETGRMMLRATNTGATAIIDPHGYLLAHAPHFETTVLEGEAQGYSGATPYVRWGNWPFVGLAFGLLALLWVRKKK
jgi:apolipoprotein N-acyltransferase